MLFNRLSSPLQTAQKSRGNYKSLTTSLNSWCVSSLTLTPSVTANGEGGRRWNAQTGWDSDQWHEKLIPCIVVSRPQPTTADQDHVSHPPPLPPQRCSWKQTAAWQLNRDPNREGSSAFFPAEVRCLRPQGLWCLQNVTKTPFWERTSKKKKKSYSQLNLYRGM